jgi:polyisoprenoid-binding protein YceI
LKREPLVWRRSLDKLISEPLNLKTEMKNLIRLANTSSAHPSPLPSPLVGRGEREGVRGVFVRSTATALGAFNRITLGLLTALALGLTTAQAQTYTKYQSQFGASKVRMEGTSTLHDWHAEGTLIGGALELDSAFPQDGSAKPGPVAAKAEIKIPVRSLKCSSGAAMDSVMQQAMDEPKNPQILFTLTELKLKEAPKAGEAMKFEATGNLTVSGVRRTVTMDVGITVVEAGKKLKLNGVVPLKMSTFGIQPPSPKAALGVIKTGADVKIVFEWVCAVPAK